MRLYTVTYIRGALNPYLVMDGSRIVAGFRTRKQAETEMAFHNRIIVAEFEQSSRSVA
jgi:hypothetical protein